MATHKYGRSFVRHGAWLALVLGFCFIVVHGGSTQDESSSPTQAREVLRRAIDLYKAREYEKAGPFFAYVKPIQQTLEPSDRQDFNKFTALNALALKGRKDGSNMIRMAEDAVQKGRTKDAGNLLKSLDANQYLTPVERQHVLELRRRLETRKRAAPAPKARPDAKSLLTAGRAALQAGDLAASEALANQADQVNSLVPDWLQPWNDSPAKLRRDIRTARAKQMEIVAEIVPNNSETNPADPNQSKMSSTLSGIRPFGNVNLEESPPTELTCVSPSANQIQEPARPQGANGPVYDPSAHTDYYGASGLHAQTSNSDVITLKFAPAQASKKSGLVPAVHLDKTAQTISAVGFGYESTPRGTGEGDDSYVRTELPGPQRLFRRDSEAQFFDRLRVAQKKEPGVRTIFPDEPVISKEPWKPRNYPHLPLLVEPGYVCHGRLYFEQPNFERIGYDFGVLQPGISLGVFYYDAFMLPYHIWTDLRVRGECSAGKCLPGDPAPLRVPCERFSVTGLLGQTGTLIGFGFLFP